MRLNIKQIDKVDTYNKTHIEDKVRIAKKYLVYFYSVSYDKQYTLISNDYIIEENIVFNSQSNTKLIDNLIVFSNLLKGDFNNKIIGLLDILTILKLYFK